MNFNLNTTAGAKESGNKLTPGIKECTFEGVEFTTVTSQKNGKTYNALALKLKIDGYGDYTQNFFEPESNERAEGQWGLQASQLDHFLIIVREILEAVDPKIVEDMDNKALKKSDGTPIDTSKLNFKQTISLIQYLTKDYIGKAMQVKMVPQNNGYCSIPSYPARITRNNDLAISTRFIGDNLVLNASELKKIEAANTAKPTNMASSVSVDDTLDKMGEDLNLGSSDDSDLPF